MPPVHSKGSRPDFTSTPRGFRTEKGNAPRHQTKGGKSDFTGTPKGKGKGKDQEKERRDRIIEDAFQAKTLGIEASKRQPRIFKKPYASIFFTSRLYGFCRPRVPG